LHKYCEICRDEGDLDIRCAACGGAFHAFCYGETYDPARLKLPREGWTCEPCHMKYGDTFCTACHQGFNLAVERREDIQKCPGCSKQIHLDCAEKMRVLVDTSRGELVTDDIETIKHQWRMEQRQQEAMKLGGEEGGGSSSSSTSGGAPGGIPALADAGADAGVLCLPAGGPSSSSSSSAAARNAGGGAAGGVEKSMRRYPDHIMWVCDGCTRRIKMKVRRAQTMQHGRVVRDESMMNKNRDQLHQAFCEVCQKGGKLLMCDTCPKSYHSTCIEHLVSLDQVGLAAEWRCPVCLGIDLYATNDAMRLSEPELEERLRMKNMHNARRIKWVTKRRNAYLSQYLAHEISPFVSKQVYATIKKDANFVDKTLRMGDVVRVSAEGGFAFKQVDDGEGREGGAGAAGHALRRAFIGTVLEEAHMAEDGTVTVVDHNDPGTIIKVKPNGCKYLCSASQRSRKYKIARQVCDNVVAGAAGIGGSSSSTTTTSNAPGGVEIEQSVFLARTKNGVDFLAEGVKLKDYQVFGVDWITNCFCDRGGCLLADDMGLGKTLQALAFLANLHHVGHCGPHLVVVPYAVVGNWLRECRKFCPQLKIAKIAGGKSEQEWILDNNEVRFGERDVYITTYETLVGNEAFFAGIVWQTVTLDEAHRIKNQAGRVRMALAHIETSFRLLLTGTPLQNNIQELFVLLNYVWPDVLQDSKAFQEAISFENVAAISEEVERVKREHDEVLKENENGDFNLNFADASVRDRAKQEAVNSVIASAGFSRNEVLLEKVRTLLEKLMLRRTKAEVLRLPPKMVRDVWLPLCPTGVFWARVVFRCHDELMRKKKNSANGMRMLMSLLLKIRLICCHPRALTKSKAGDNIFTEFDCTRMYPNLYTMLNNAHGEAHMQSTNKVMFLDKLLTQLYCENVDKVPLWKSKHAENSDQRPTSCGLDDVRELVKDLNLYENVMKTYDFDATMGSAAVAGNQGVAPMEVDGEGDEDDLVGVNLNGTTGDEVLNADGAKPEPDLKLPESLGSGAQAASSSSSSGPAAASSSTGPRESQQLPKTASATSTASGVGATSKKQYKPHKVILFTQFQMILDELEAYCKWRRWKYLRLDGSTNKVVRELDVKEFNSIHDSHHLVYLMSTRAGGVGINLQSANFVVIYDQDWNPHIDTQAMDRAHRIGQDRPVTVYRLLTEWTVEERLAHRCSQKLNLNKALIEDDASHDVGADEKLSLEEVLAFLKHGRQVLVERFNGLPIAHLEIPEVLNRTHQTLPMIEGNSPTHLVRGQGAGPRGHANGAGGGAQHLANHVGGSVNGASGGAAAASSSSAFLAAPSQPAAGSAASSSGASDADGINGNAFISVNEMLPPSASPASNTSSEVGSSGEGGSSGVGSAVGAAPATSSSSAPFGGPFMNMQTGGSTSSTAPFHPGAGQQPSNPLLAANRPGKLIPLDAQMKLGASQTVRSSAFETTDDGKTVRRSRRQKAVAMRNIANMPPPGAAYLVEEDPEPVRKKHTFCFKYDRDCFVCRQPTYDAKGQPILCAPATSGAGGEDEQHFGMTPLICAKCPKTFHAKCQGVSTLPKTFVCSWHECLVCRRRAGDVGGMLIQCTGCPKAYCIDCFPQSFRRVYPEESFFAKLQNQGWDHATPSRMVNFECNDCRARREQEEQNAVDLALAKEKEKELMEKEKKRLREEKKTTEKQNRAKAKEEQEKMRLANNANSAAVAKAMKKRGGKKDSQDMSASPNENPESSVQDANEERKQERQKWLRIRDELAKNYTQLLEDKLPIDIGVRLKLFRADKSELENRTTDELSSYYDTSEEMLKKHLFDLYFEVEDGLTEESLLQHLDYAKKEQENDPEIAKAATFALGTGLPVLCKKCYIPGHKMNECPFPADYVLKEVQAAPDNDADAAAAAKPKAKAKAKAKNPPPKRCCPICGKMHRKMLCPELSEEDFEHYKGIFTKLDLFLSELKEHPRLPHAIEYDKMHLEDACKDANFGRRIFDEVVVSLLTKCELDRYIVAPAPAAAAPPGGDGRGAEKDGAKSRKRKGKEPDHEPEPQKLTKRQKKVHEETGNKMVSKKSKRPMKVDSVVADEGDIIGAINKNSNSSSTRSGLLPEARSDSAPAPKTGRKSGGTTKKVVAVEVEKKPASSGSSSKASKAGARAGGVEKSMKKK